VNSYGRYSGPNCSERALIHICVRAGSTLPRVEGLDRRDFIKLGGTLAGATS
jgi:hypothetical protein